MFAVSRFSPIEWENEDPCDEAAGVDELTQELFIIIGHCKLMPVLDMMNLLHYP